MSKKIRTGHLSLDPYEHAIVVEYEVTITDLDTGEVETTQKETKVRLKTIKPDANLTKLANGIIDKCKYISDKHFDIVEQLVHDLKRRQNQDDEEDLDQQVHDDVSMDSVDDYMEMLYGGEEDMVDKIKGSANILKLCTNVGNLETLIQNMQLMSALSRVFADDFKRSTELSFNLCRIFLSFSNFMEMHSILSNYRVGALTMKVVELELKRTRHKTEERTKAMEDMVEISKKQEMKDAVLARRQDKIIFVALHLLINLAEDVTVEKKMVKKNLVAQLTENLNRRTPDCLMLILTFLRKLSIFSENKVIMANKEVGTIHCLCKFLPCSHDKLTQAALRLLFNLSFDKDCRKVMVDAGMLPKLVGLLKKAPFRAKTIRLLYHLSADDRTKRLLSKTDTVPIVMQLVINFPHNIIAKELAALTVNISLDARCALQMTEHRGLQHLMSRVGEYGDVLLAKVVRNISQWTLGEQRMITHLTEHVGKMKTEIRRQRKAQRAIDNLANGGSVEEEAKFEGNDESEEDDEAYADLPRIPNYKEKRLWAEHIQPLVKMALDCDSHDLLVELLGTIGNMTENDLPKGRKWSSLIKDYNLCAFLGKLLVPGMSQNDIVLEVIIIIGQMCTDEKSSILIASSSLIRAMHDIWQDKSDDSEVILQLLHTFYRMLHFQETREELLYSTESMADICDCVGSKNRAIRVNAEKCLEMILEYDRNEVGEIGELGAQVRRRRFLAHNKEWMEEVGGKGGREDRVYRHGGGGMMMDSDDELMGGAAGDDWRRDDDDDDDENDEVDYDNYGNNHNFVTGSGQKIAFDTSGLSSGGEGSRDAEYGGWGQ